ncbi:MAG: 50S ribosomal protein L20 [Fusobacterium sp. JB021]|nr:50S ribosomal protein L20 [Fusobacterium sp. JB021]MDP0506964.1 50S ribosomal protein L20 [Fusobacterium sp. JB019]
MRVKTGVVRRRKHKKILKAAKGFRGASGDVVKQAKQAVMRAMAFSTRDRKVRRRKMRQLWIIRINAGARLNGMTYSTFMNGLKRSGVELDRKVLADMALNNAEGFAKLADAAKAALA